MTDTTTLVQLELPFDYTSVHVKSDDTEHTVTLNLNVKEIPKTVEDEILTSSLSLQSMNVSKPFERSKRVITIRHNSDYGHDTVEVLDGARLIMTGDFSELDPTKLAEVLRWLGHPVRLIEYMFEHDIAEYG